MGKRLKSLTEDKTKCMVSVNGITLIERMLGQLDDVNLDSVDSLGDASLVMNNK